MTVKQLILNGKTLEAIQELARSQDKYTQDAAIGLSSRWNRLSREINLGLISNQDATIERNKIVDAVLSYAGQDVPQTQYYQENPSIGYSLTQKIADIVAQNKRRRPDLAEQAQSILNQYRDYQDGKRANPSFDVAGRRLKAIDEQAGNLIRQLENEKDNDLEGIVERIAQNLIAPVPEYSNLNEAYRLASGRGMKDVWIEQQLNQQPDDVDVQITIAERIEAFAANIVRR